MSDADPIAFRPDELGMRTVTSSSQPQRKSNLPVRFTRSELNQIFNLYGRKVADGEWRDYALDMDREKAVFSVFRRTSEMPLYRIVKDPKLARKQGAYSVVTATGLILKRGAELEAGRLSPIRTATQPAAGQPSSSNDTNEMRGPKAPRSRLNRSIVCCDYSRSPNNCSNIMNMLMKFRYRFRAPIRASFAISSA